MSIVYLNISNFYWRKIRLFDQISRLEVSRLEVSRLWLFPQYAGFADDKEQEVVVGSEVGQAGS
jgi:hypothetical protein